MCLAKAYSMEEGEDELLLEDVTRVEIDGPKLRLSTLFGDEREIAGTIKIVDFQAGNVVVERLTPENL
jgi:predicted RNA-binding protein